MTIDNEADDEVLANERRRVARTFVSGVADASDEEKEAFIADFAIRGHHKRRIRHSHFTSFVATYRRRALDAEQRVRVASFLKTANSLLAEAGLLADDDTLFVRETAAVAHRSIQLNMSAVAKRRFADLKLTDAAIDDPEVASALLHALAQELYGKTNDMLAAANSAVVQLIDAVMAPEVASWLGGDQAVRQSFLNLPSDMAATQLITLADRRRLDALAATNRAKTDAITQVLKLALPDTRLQGKTLHQRYRELFAFLTGSIACDLVVEKALTSAEFNQLAQAVREYQNNTQQLQSAINELLERPRIALLTKIGDQIDTLARKVRTLPHIDYLGDEEIVHIVAPYYAGLDRALKKRRARHALVAVEERAREAKYREDVERLAAHRADYADPAHYYPLARSLSRELVLFVGPTNSGKTWRALNELATGDSGAYLAPLRLLALEGQEELEKRGKPASFLTGEERDIRPDAKFISSTIEMLSLDTPVDAVVVDEVQLLADERRGWAWLAAVMGAPAKRVIMTGSPDCVEMIQGIADYLGEPLTIHECKRYNELHVADAPKRLRDVDPGTAIVCFSRRDVLRLKEQIEATTDLKVAVVYGNLSPQVRREEARRFRSGEADVLVATDAIAMGLNLPIKEVVFYTTEKFDGEQMRELTASEIRQIAGRAGRYGFAQYGVASTLTAHGLSLIRAAIRSQAQMLTPPFYVAPGPNHVRIIGKVLGSDSLERILTFFERAIEFSDERFARSNIDELSYLSTFVDQELAHLPLTERLTVASAPVDIKSELVLSWFLERMLPAFRSDATDETAPEAQALQRLFIEARRFEHDTAASSEELRRAEDYLKTLTVYAWLAYRYPDVFNQLALCEEKRELVNAFIERSLRREVSKRCAACSKKLPRDFAYRLCEPCFATTKHRRRSSRRGFPAR